MLWAAVKPKASPVTLFAVLATGALALVPLVYLTIETFFADGAFTLDAFDAAYAVDGVGTLVGNSLLFAAGSTVVALAVGTLQALLVLRTDVPGRRLILAGALLPLFVPGLLYTIAWVLLASPRTGMLNAWLPGTLDVFGLGGMVVAEGLHGAPLVFLIVAAALLAQDAAHEEAAAVAGARTRTILRRITLPLLTPALTAAALLTVVRALESFEVPALLGVPGGRPVFISRIFESLGRFPADVPAAGAASLSLLVLTGLGVVLVARIGRRGRRFQVTGGAGRRPARLPLGRYRPAAALAGLATTLVAGVLPLFALLYASLQRFYAPPSAESLDRLTLEPYRRAFEGGSLEALATSFGLAAVAATIITALMAVCAWVVVRTRLPGRAALDAVSSLPLALPGLVVGVALLVVSTRVTVLYGTLALVVLAYVTRFMPYGMRYAVAAMQQVAQGQEEAATVAGARWTTTFRRVVLPVVTPGLAAGWLYVLALCVRELSSVLLLVAPGTELVATRIFGSYQQGEFAQLSALGVVVAALLGGATALAWRLGGRRIAG